MFMFVGRDSLTCSLIVRVWHVRWSRAFDVFVGRDSLACSLVATVWHVHVQNGRESSACSLFANIETA